MAAACLPHVCTVSVRHYDPDLEPDSLLLDQRANGLIYVDMESKVICTYELQVAQWWDDLVARGSDLGFESPRARLTRVTVHEFDFVKYMKFEFEVQLN